MTHLELNAIGRLIVSARVCVWKRQPWTWQFIASAGRACRAEVEGRVGEIRHWILHQDLHGTDGDNEHWEPFGDASFWDGKGVTNHERVDGTLRPFLVLMDEVLEEAWQRVIGEDWARAEGLLDLIHEIPSDLLAFRQLPFSSESIDLFVSLPNLPDREEDWRKLMLEGVKAYEALGYPDLTDTSKEPTATESEVI